VTLVSVDELSRRHASEMAHPETALALARQIIEEELTRVMVWLRERLTAPEIRSLGRISQHLETQELERLARRLPHLDGATLDQLQRAMRRYCQKLLHPLYRGLRREVGGIQAHSLDEITTLSSKSIR
jgi:glutamyl-tRNA reductase